jgi:solute carrier family 35 protein E3
VNTTNYLVIGKTSALTYQVLGHFKTIMILVLGFLVFNKKLDMRNVAGIIVAMGGVIWYTEVKRKEGTAKPLSSPGFFDEKKEGLLSENNLKV